jgi:hypothetical protein
MPPLLGLLTVSDGSGDGLLVGTGETFEIRRYTPEGRLSGVIRWPGKDLSIDPAELEAARRSRVELVRGNTLAESMVTQILGTLPVPEARPSYAALKVDALRYVWVGEYPWMGLVGVPPRVPRVFTVFDPQARRLGDVEVPDGLEVLEIGEDYVLGVRTATTGQRVALYRLIRSTNR